MKSEREKKLGKRLLNNLMIIIYYFIICGFNQKIFLSKNECEKKVGNGELNFKLNLGYLRIY